MKIVDQAWKLRDLIPKSELYPHVNADYPTRRLAVTSGKGGVGKSVVALNLALLLAGDELKTLLIDGDINLSKLPILTDTSPQYTYTDVSRGEKKLLDVIYEYKPNCSILPTGSGALELVNQEEDIRRLFSQQFRLLDGTFDYMIVDTASGISSLVFGEIASCDEVLLIITPEPTSIADAYAVIKIASYYYPQLPLHVVFNMVESEDEALESFRRLNLIVQKFLHRPLNWLGFLYFEQNVLQSVKRQVPLAVNDLSEHFMKNLTKIKNRWLEFNKNFPHFQNSTRNLVGA